MVLVLTIIVTSWVVVKLFTNSVVFVVASSSADEFDLRSKVKFVEFWSKVKFVTEFIVAVCPEADAKSEVVIAVARAAPLAAGAADDVIVTIVDSATAVGKLSLAGAVGSGHFVFSKPYHILEIELFHLALAALWCQFDLPLSQPQVAPRTVRLCPALYLTIMQCRTL